MLTELLVIVALTLANGLFAATEIAILSVRKTRLRELAAEGNGAARSLLDMRAEPERFLATVQIGITVIGATAAAFGGATVSHAFSAALERIGVDAETADKLGLALVISLISYLSLVLGELVPKSLALQSAERYALLASRPLAVLAWLARPIVWFLTASSNVVLRLFRDRTTFTEARLSKEELQQLVDEAATVGSLDARSGEIASRALEFGDVRVGGLMVPRADMVTFARDASREDVRELLLSRPHSRIPVYVQAPDDIVGYVTGRDLVRLAASGEGSVRDIVRPGLFVPEGARAANVLVEMQQRRDHLALVVNEDGTVTGLVTMEDSSRSWSERSSPSTRRRWSAFAACPTGASWCAARSESTKSIESSVSSFPKAPAGRQSRALRCPSPVRSRRSAHAFRSRHTSRSRSSRRRSAVCSRSASRPRARRSDHPTPSVRLPLSLPGTRAHEASRRARRTRSAS